MNESIVIKGAREHNLKNVDLTIPRNKMVVFTGLSGSGKSSLAFDTLYAEGQRRYVESLSSYARMFLGQMEKPDVDSIDGLSPAISIDQKTTSKNPRSTVGTVTEIYDYLRLLWARIGVPHCPKCGKEIRQQSIDQMIDRLLALPERTRLQVCAPVIRGKKGEHAKVLEDARKAGYVRARIDGVIRELDEEITLEKQKKHNIEIVIDRLVMRDGIRTRLTDSIETAARQSGGLVFVDTTLPESAEIPPAGFFDVHAGVTLLSGEEDPDPRHGMLVFSQNYACEDCGISIEELAPRLFSFNNPYGACPTCMGLGVQMKIDPDAIVPDKTLSVNEGAIRASGWNIHDPMSMAGVLFRSLAQTYGFSLDTPWQDLPEDIRHKLLYGIGDAKIPVKFRHSDREHQYSYEGVICNLERRYTQSDSDAIRADIEECMTSVDCPDCHGLRLKKEALAVTVGGENIADYTALSVNRALAFVDSLQLSPREHLIADRILKEIRERLGFLASVGLDYLTLSRSAATLSGGESQRIRLATQIGSYLMGVLYILDEPSIGLHQRDNDKLLATLRRLRDLGNTLVVVEHDEDTMRAADYIVDIGPGAGVHGGEIVAEGSLEDICACERSLTGQYLSGKKHIPVPKTRRPGNGSELVIRGARANNLKGIDVAIPLGKFTCCTGVSGSGKSSLINEILYKRLSADLNGSKLRPGPHDGIDGMDKLDKIIAIDQSPIGRTPRSNPATYTGVFNDIRSLFAATPDAKTRGYGPGRFSFNIRGGRCEACSGDGLIKIEMHFLPDIYVPCEVCQGRRYNRETLEVHYKGKSIYDVLDMTVEEALPFFENVPRIQKKIQTLHDVGLGYVKLGQSSTTLSGGEAQRVKLATELSRRATGRTIYVLDEPTTGLHVADVHRLIDVLDALTDAGNTVVVIEHNLEVIKCADHIIDLGPEGGDRGGTVVCTGTPGEVAACAASYTGRYLKPMLERG